MHVAELAQPVKPAARLWEIDTLRGIAVVLMVFYHCVWDLNYFRLTSINVFDPSWQTFARGIGTTFIFVMGLSLTLDDTRRRAREAEGLSGLSLWGRTLRRGAQIFGFGLIITAVTYFTVRDQYVRFGILHLLGASIVLATPFLRLPPLVSVAWGLALILLGSYLNTRFVDFPWLTWLGVPQSGLVMADYYPLLPWFGIALLGIAAGKLFYPEGRRGFVLPDLSAIVPVRALRFLGRHSLTIYLIHQPIILGLLIGLGLGSF